MRLTRHALAAPRIRAGIAVAVVAGALAGPSNALPPSGAAPRQLMRPAPVALDSLEAALLSRLNSVRKQHGLRPLKIARGLARAADTHARAMARAGFFAHESADGTSAGDRIRRFYAPRGRARWTVGETLLWRSPGVSPDEAVEAWLASPSHRKVILLPGFREIGLSAISRTDAPGDFRGLDVTILVADFGSR